MATPKQWFRDAIADFRANRTGNNRRAQIRADVAEMVTAAQKWLNEQDAQENEAKSLFATDRQGQFNTFVDALPPVNPDQAP